MQADRKVPAPRRRSERPATPKHSRVAGSLLSQIRSGHYQPGDLLPSEPELCRHFGVSRHTVRVALRSLYEKGLILSQQGRGSVVLAAPTSPRYTFGCSSLDDLLQYAATTTRDLCAIERVTTDAGLAQWLECAPGSVWWSVHTRRLQPEGGAAIASSRIWVPERYGEAVSELATSPLPLFALMEARDGHHVAEVVQAFSVASANHEEAADLGLAPDAAVMCVERRFRDQRGALLEVSRSVHPPEAFHYQITVRQVRGPEPG